MCYFNVRESDILFFKNGEIRSPPCKNVMGGFGGLSAAVTRRPGLAVLVWVVLIAASAVVGPQLDQHLVGISDDAPGSDSSAVRQEIEEEFAGRFNQTLLVVFKHPSLTVSDAAFSDLVNATLALILNRSEISGGFSALQPSPNPQLVSADGHITYIVAGFVTSDQDVAGRQIPELSAAIRAVPNEGFEVYPTGQAAALADIQRISEADAQRAETYAIPLAIVVLIIIIGGLLAAFLPLLLGFVAILGMLAVTALVAPYFDMSVYVKNIGFMLGLGLGIDYSLLIVSRFKEEIARGLAPPDAALRTTKTAGRAVAFSGATVALGFGALLAPDIPLIRSIGLGGLVIVLTSVLVATTLLPALLVLLGRRVEWPRALSKAVTRLRSQGFWERAAMRVLRRPKLYLGGVLLLLVPLSLFSYALTPIEPGASSLPDEASSHQGLTLLEEGFGPGVNGPILITVENPSGSIFTNESIDAVEALTHALEGRTDVDKVSSITNLVPDADASTYKALYANGKEGISNPALRSAVEYLTSGDDDTTLITVYLAFDPSLPAAQQVVEDLRGAVIPATPPLAGFKTLVGGTPANAVDTNAATYNSLVLVVVIILAATYVVLLVLFRSVVLPFKTILENILSVTASIGFLVLIFEFGLGTTIFGFRTFHGVTFAIPVIQFALLFGLSMDYQIFILSRIKEEWDTTHDNDRAVAFGLEKTGGVVTSAALVMITVFGLFSTSNLIFLKELGLGLAFAVLVDATLVRTVAVPAGMKLLADRNWYIPAWLDRRLPRVSIEGIDPQPAASVVDVGDPSK
jgi:RND superfamily putative drug exporter